MKTGIIDRYIAKTILISIFGVLFVIATLDVLFAFVDELDSVREHYTAWHAFQYVAFQMPKSLYEFIPVSSLIGSLIGLGYMASNSELIVLRAAGLSVMRIVGMVIRAVMLVLIVGIILVQWLVPKSTQIAENLRAFHLGGGDALYIKKGNWQRDGKHFIHFNLIQPDGTLLGLTRFKLDEKDRLVEIFFSEKAAYLSPGLWQLSNVKITRLFETKTQASSNTLETWRTELTPEKLLKLVLKPDHLSITGLAEYIHYLKGQGLNAQRYELSFWKKSLQPFVTLVMVVIAASFAFGSLRSATMGYRITMGIILGLVYQYLQDFLGYSSLVYQLEPYWATLVPLLVFAAIGFFNLRRVH